MNFPIMNDAHGAVFLQPFHGFAVNFRSILYKNGLIKFSGAFPLYFLQDMKENPHSLHLIDRQDKSDIILVYTVVIFEPLLIF